MNNPSEIQSVQSMSSRQIAVATGKKHFNVIRDIEKMIKEVNSDLSWLTYVDEQGKQRKEYLLDEELTLTLISGYSIKLRNKVVKEWIELKKGVNKISIHATEAEQKEIDLIKKSVPYDIDLFLVDSVRRNSVLNKVVNELNLKLGSYEKEIAGLKDDIKSNNICLTRVVESLNLKERSRFVYLVTDGDYVKIGISYNPEGRLASLQTSNPRKLCMIHKSKHINARELESILHEEYKDFNEINEWFNLNSEQISHTIDFLNENSSRNIFERNFQKSNISQNELKESIEYMHKNFLDNGLRDIIKDNFN